MSIATDPARFGDSSNTLLLKIATLVQAGHGGGGTPAVASIVFHTQPSGAVAGAPFTTQPVVWVLDGGGNRILSFTGPVSVSLDIGAGTMTGTNVVNCVAGVATFTNLAIDTGGDCQLEAVNDEAPSYPVNSNTFSVAYGPKRKAVSIAGSSGVQANYQVKVTVAYDSDMSADFSDIRFTAADGTTLLSCWMDPSSKTDSVTADFWVKVPSIAASPTVTTIYFYYGHAAASVSNGDATFLLFDDFSPYAAGFYQGFNKDAGNPIVSATQAWEASGGLEDLKITQVGSLYYGFYASAVTGQQLNIGYMTMPVADYPGGTWTKYASNPVLTHGSQSGVDDNLISAPQVIAMQDGSFRMYYHANGSGGHDRGCVAMATAGGFPNTWTKYVSNPILDVGAGGSWDAGYIHNEITTPPWESPDGSWHCMYGGADATGTIWRGGHATSSDGLTWTKDGANPIFLPGTASQSEFDSNGVHPVGQVKKVGSLYYMPYQGFDTASWRIGVATTTDFATFTKSTFNPLVVEGLSGAWDGGSAENPGVVYDAANNILDLWYVAAATISDITYSFGLARQTTSVTNRLNPVKWNVSTFGGGGFVHYPRVVSGLAKLDVTGAAKQAILSHTTFNAAAIEGRFNTTGLGSFASQTSIGFGYDSNHYIQGQRINLTPQSIRAEHVINGSYADSGGSAASYNTGWVKVTRTGSVTAIYIKQNYGDAWTLLQGSISDTMTDLPAMMSIYNATSSSYDDVLVRNFASPEPSISSIGSEESV